MPDSVEQLWSQYKASHPAAPDHVPASFHFCDKREDADLCAQLVLAGRKRATAASLAELELAGDPVPRPGDHAIVTDWEGRAKAVIRTTSVEIRRFGDVDEEFARTEGEGDLSLIWWRTAHRAYFQRVLAGSGHAVDDELKVVCETFELVLAVD